MDPFAGGEGFRPQRKRENSLGPTFASRLEGPDYAQAESSSLIDS